MPREIADRASASTGRLNPENSRAKAMPSASGSAPMRRFTRPTCSASFAVSVRAVRIISIARDSPIRRDSRCVPP